MPTAEPPRRPSSAEFLLRAALWGVGIFGLLRLGWVERSILLPLTQAQGSLAVLLCGTPTRPIAATLACSGADVVAICLGVILAYPARWRVRLVGAVCGLLLILALNTLRIGTLGRIAASPSLFEIFHVYLWPAALSLAVAGYVFAWMRRADRIKLSASSPPSVRAAAPPSEQQRGFRPTRRFVLLAGVLILGFTAAGPLYLESTRVLSAAALIARAAAVALRLLGVEARATENLLWTSRGSFLVTQECISTPLIPIYLAAVLAFGGAWWSRLAAALAAVPLFVGLGVARLLVVAVPPSLAASPTYLIHAFFQILLAAVLVLLAALHRHRERRAALRLALLGMALGLAFVLLFGPPYTGALQYLLGVVGVGAGTAGLPPPADPQGAIALLPSFQIGLYLALWVAAGVTFGRRRFGAGLALLVLSQPAVLAAIPLLNGVIGPSLQVQAVRAWAVAAPVLVVLLVTFARKREGEVRPGAARDGFAHG